MSVRDYSIDTIAWIPPYLSVNDYYIPRIARIPHFLSVSEYSLPKIARIPPFSSINDYSIPKIARIHPFLSVNGYYMPKFASIPPQFVMILSLRLKGSILICFSCLLPSAVIGQSSTFCSEIVISKLFETQFQIICAQQL